MTRQVVVRHLFVNKHATLTELEVLEELIYNKVIRSHSDGIETRRASHLQNCPFTFV